jgi:hypothetical protein
MSIKYIEIRRILDVSVLSTRATARYLFNKEIKKYSQDSFKLDFKGIEFASRSFMDELNLLIKKYSLAVHKINMNSQIQQMDELVLTTEQSQFFTENKSFSSANVVTL